MIFTETKLRGAFTIDLERREDNRGFFARTFCQHEFEEHGLRSIIAQVNLASNKRKGTLRGMHFQYPPAAETKLVRCTRGAIHRHHRRPAPGEPDVPRARRGRAQRRQLPRALRARALRARLPGARGPDGDELPGRRVLHAGRRGRAVAARPRARAALAAAGHGDLREGRRLGAALGGRGRPQAAHGRRRGGDPMIIVDTALRRREEEGRPIQVALIGAGFMAQGLANQIVNSVPGMRLAAVYGRKLERALGVWEYAGVEGAVVASGQAEVEDAIRAGRPVATEDAFALSQAEQIDALVDVTGSVEFGSQVVLEAIRHGKHMLLMNAELDA